MIVFARPIVFDATMPRV